MSSKINQDMEIEQLNKDILTATKIIGNGKIRSYLIGGAVRDYLLQRPVKDYDYVCVSLDESIDNCGIKVAEQLGKVYNQNVTVFPNFGTANLHIEDLEVEFVGARKEKYIRGSRKPVIEKGTLDDDQERRDFTINAMAFDIENNNTLIDKFGGVKDLQNGIIRCVTSPSTVFEEDALRMLRAIRFACQLGFKIDDATWAGILANADQMKIQNITGERIFVELNKIMKSDNSALGIELIHTSGLSKYIFPDIAKLDFIKIYPGSIKPGINNGHKNNFWHTIKVLKNLDNLDPEIKSMIKGELYLIKWGALWHDSGKTDTIKWDADRGWTFDSHQILSLKLFKAYVRKFKLQFNVQELEYIYMIIADHERIKQAASKSASAKALRRIILLSELVNLKNHEEKELYLPDLLIFGMNDSSSASEAKRRMFKSTYRVMLDDCIKVIESDNLRNMSLAVDGNYIKDRYGLNQGSLVGEIKDFVKNAFLDGIIPNEFHAMAEYMETNITFSMVEQCKNGAQLNSLLQLDK
jgi:poly(A) polymerase